ncbi:MAG: hypothetical protein KF708_12690 [Pirellulales bacterium]|nr:hypothetical protein [Pirellulales bacterium]
MAAIAHPAMFDLLRLQSQGRARRIARRFCQPRRLILSALACVLAVVWLGNAAMTVWLRDPAGPTTLRAMLSLGLLMYAAWHFAKAAFFRAESPFDWTPAERELLDAMPLRSRDLVTYQLASVTVTTVLKAALFTVLLLPDLHSVTLGLIGLTLVMLLLEVLRMAIEIATWGMGRGAFLIYRALVVTGLIAAGFELGQAVIQLDTFRGEINVGDGLLARLVDILVQVNASGLGYATLPFQPFIHLILADRLTSAHLVLAAFAATLVLIFACGVIGLHALTVLAVARRQRRDYRNQRPAQVDSAKNQQHTRHPSSWMGFPYVPHLAGAGAMAWRQLVGAGRQWGSLLTAMIAPAVLASAPCFVIKNPYLALVFTIGTMAFYTFLLLPTALRFDFRRDLDHLATFKCLPISPCAAAIGQIAAPVAIASLYQLGVLGLAIFARELPWYYLPLSMVVMVPLNVMVFALDNLIFLLYPHRLQQEGLEIFLRTMLTFTGKGLLFSIGLAVISAWGFAAAAIANACAASTGTAWSAFSVFAAGMVAGPTLLAIVTLYVLSRTYGRLDPIEDVPR